MTSTVHRISTHSVPFVGCRGERDTPRSPGSHADPREEPTPTAQRRLARLRATREAPRMATCASCRAAVPAGARFLPGLRAPGRAAGLARRRAQARDGPVRRPGGLDASSPTPRTRSARAPLLTASTTPWRTRSPAAAERSTSSSAMPSWPSSAPGGAGGSRRARPAHRARDAAEARRRSSAARSRCASASTPATWSWAAARERFLRDGRRGERGGAARGGRAAGRDPGRGRTVQPPGDAFELGDPRTIEAKGKTGGVACHRLAAPVTLSAARNRAASPFVGREAEIEALEPAYAPRRLRREPGARDGHRGRGRRKDDPHPPVLAPARGERSPEPVRRAGRCARWARGSLQAAGRHRPRALRAAPERSGRDGARSARRARDPRPDAGVGRPAGLHPLAAQDRLRQAWIGFLEELVAQGPAVVLVEDLHWAEAALVGLLESALREVRGPLLLLGTARPEFVRRHPAWGRDPEAGTSAGGPVPSDASAY